MKHIAFLILSMFCFASSAQAALIEFDISDVTFANDLDAIAPYQMGGDTTFLFDTQSELISGVNVVSPETGVTYTSGTWSGGVIELQSAGTFEIFFDMFVDIATLEGLGVGDSITRFPAGDEAENVPMGFFAFISGGGIQMTRLPDPPAVPLPAGLPLLMSAAGFLFLRRRLLG